MHRPWHIESMSNVCEDEPLSRHPWCLSETFPLWLTSWSLVCIRMKPSLCSVCPLGQWLKNLSGLKWQWEHMGLISQQKQIASVVTESPHNSNSTKKNPITQSTAWPRVLNGLGFKCLWRLSKSSERRFYTCSPELRVCLVYSMTLEWPACVPWDFMAKELDSSDKVSHHPKLHWWNVNQTDWTGVILCWNSLCSVEQWMVFQHLMVLYWGGAKWSIKMLGQNYI